MRRLLTLLPVFALAACSPQGEPPVPQADTPAAEPATPTAAPANHADSTTGPAIAPTSSTTSIPLGSSQWFAWVDQHLSISDDGHGPDPGSDEWNRAVQFKLGAEAPQSAIGSPAWQQSVDALLRARTPAKH